MRRILAIATGLVVVAMVSAASAGPGCCSKSGQTSASAACAKGEKASAAACEMKTKQASATTVRVLKLSVDGMHCTNCKTKVQDALNNLQGVQSAKVSYTRKNAEVTYDPTSLNDDAIVAAINATGYTASVKSAKSAEAKASSDACCKTGSKVEAASAREGCCKAKEASKVKESGT